MTRALPMPIEAEGAATPEKDIAQQESEALLSVSGLTQRYDAGRQGLFGRARQVEAVAGISFEIRRGEVFGLVGESGCGKSSVAKAILNVQTPSGGTVRLGGRDLSALSRRQWQALRRDVQYVFQDPLGALDPRMTIVEQVMEPLIVHRIGTAAERRKQARELMAAVGMDASLDAKFPHELSGGQRQRAVIARALILRPRLLVCDEPVSALDVSIQAQVVALLQDLRREFNLTILFISHDLSLVRYLCDRVAVMYLGQIVEQGAVDQVFDRPRHPYTQALLSAVAIPDPRRRLAPAILPGEPPSALSPPSGCRFHTRCPKAQAICHERLPVAEAVGRDHLAACHLAQAGG